METCNHQLEFKLPNTVLFFKETFQLIFIEITTYLRHYLCLSYHTFAGVNISFYSLRKREGKVLNLGHFKEQFFKQDHRFSSIDLKISAAVQRKERRKITFSSQILTRTSEKIRHNRELRFCAIFQKFV